MMATGFLAAGVHSTQITKNEVEKHRYDELDDMLAHDRHGDARADGRLRPVPRPQIRRDPAGRLLPHALDLHGHGANRGEHRRRPGGLPEGEGDMGHGPRTAVEGTGRLRGEGVAGPIRSVGEEQAGKPVPPTWVIPRIVNVRSAGNEATLTRKDDGSVLVGGANPPREMLAFNLETDVSGLTALRIEALMDPSLVKNGPGRAANGNFCLTDLTVVAGPKGGKSAPVKLKNPRSTFDQKGLGVATAIDGDPNGTGWAIDPQFGFDHAATFEFETPIEAKGNIALTVILKFNHQRGPRHGSPANFGDQCRGRS